MRPTPRLAARALLVTLFPMLFACGDGDNGTGPDVNSLVGTWNVTSITLGGEEVAAGTDLSATLAFASDLAYSLTVTGDAEGFFCGDSSSCTETGTYAHSETVMTLCDPACDEALDYTITGGTLRISFTDGDTLSPVVVTLVRA